MNKVNTMGIFTNDLTKPSDLHFLGSLFFKICKWYINWVVNTDKAIYGWIKLLHTSNNENQVVNNGMELNYCDKTGIK